MTYAVPAIATVEQYVAYWLAARGFNVNMIRSRASTMDLLVSGQAASYSVTLRVVSSPNAHRTYIHNPAKNRSGWEISWPLERTGPGFFYAFVDQREGSGGEPEIFIVPSEKLEELMSDTDAGLSGHCSVWIEDEEMPGTPTGCRLSRKTYLENPRPLEEILA